MVNVPKLVTPYDAERPDTSVAAERVAFGTSGYRGSPFDWSFNQAHILAIRQAICLHRQAHRPDGPLFMGMGIGMDTRALFEPALTSALEVLPANGVEVMIDRAGGYTPIPAISHAILRHSRGRRSGLADGIVVNVGRTTFLDAVAVYQVHAITREASARVAERFGEWVAIFDRARPSSQSGPSAHHPGR